jgi:hypothetical protein
MKLPFKISDDNAKAMGFAPGALALPTTRKDCVFVVGMAADYGRVFSTTEAYRVIGGAGRLVAAQQKTYNLAGPINAIDVNLPSMRIYIERLCEAYNISEDSVLRMLGKPLDDFRALCTRIIGRDFLNGNLIPGEIRVVNKALAYLAAGKVDHARLFLQWPALCQVFLDFPDVIDRSVAGESMWDLMPHSFDEGSVRELKRMRKFSTAWVDSGVPTDTFIRTLCKACTNLPDGSQRPENKTEARSLIHMSELCDQAFRSLSNPMQVKVKKALFAHTDTWKSPDAHFQSEYAYDFIHYIYYNILMDGFRVNGVNQPTEEQTLKAFFGIVGGNLQRIAAASKQWHQRLPSILSVRDASMPDKWAPAVGTIHVPAFRTVESDDVITNVFIVPLDSDEELAKEGAKQRHCVYSQKRLCVEGNLRIVSIRQKIEDEFKTLSTASFFMDNGMVYIRDHRALANAEPSYISREALGWFEGQINGGNAISFNREWAMPTRSTAVSDVDLRSHLVDRFEKCRPALSKKMQKGGFEALLEECV